MKRSTVARLQPGQTFRFVSFGWTGPWHTLATKDNAVAQGYRVLVYADGTRYSCHHTNQVEIKP